MPAAVKRAGLPVKYLSYIQYLYRFGARLKILCFQGISLFYKIIYPPKDCPLSAQRLPLSLSLYLDIYAGFLPSLRKL